MWLQVENANVLNAESEAQANLTVPPLLLVTSGFLMPS